MRGFASRSTSIEQTSQPALATFKDDAAVAASVRDAIRELDAGTRREIESILAG